MTTTYADRRTLHNIESVAITVLHEHGLIIQGWKFQWNRKVRVLGECDHNTRTIYMSAKFALVNEREVWMDTLLHEIAHALAGPGHGHDYTWRRICREIGARPERCSSAGAQHVAPAHKYEGVCPKCGQVVSKAHRYGKLMDPTSTRYYVHTHCSRQRLVWRKVA